MKTNVIVFLLLLSGLTAKCQDAPAIANSHPVPNTQETSKLFASPGCVELGGSVSFSSTTYNYSPSNGSGSSTPLTMLLFAPYFGYFPVQGFELGLNPLSIESQSDGSSTQTSLLFIFAPSYNIKTASKVYPFIEGDIGYNSTNQQEPYSSTPISGMCYGGRVGFKFAIAPHALLTFAAQYLSQNYNLNSQPSYYNPSGETKQSINSFVVGVGFAIYL